MRLVVLKHINFHGKIISKYLVNISLFFIALQVFNHSQLSVNKSQIHHKRAQSDNLLGCVLTGKCQRISPHTCGSKLLMMFDCGSFFLLTHASCMPSKNLLWIHPSTHPASQSLDTPFTTTQSSGLLGGNWYLERSQAGWGKNETPHREVWTRTANEATVPMTALPQFYYEKKKDNPVFTLKKWDHKV